MSVQKREMMATPNSSRLQIRELQRPMKMETPSKGGAKELDQSAEVNDG
ncbi:hypothetical protein SAMN05216564_11093 [Halopenitus persicus]|uniref:Uncharacterized protein n=2 Tax=Halopenitus TaxID=1209988 RepID=A0A1H6IUS2_9EURY|nr:hypothetical protein SAMN05216564_11093 [Halopenitus persicus]SEH53386.1 hypothetical protein SAMN05192561_10542 [Halopenitus malekzadehii]